MRIKINFTRSRIKRKLTMVDKDGVAPKSLNIIMAGTGVGKSMLMCHDAAKKVMTLKKVLAWIDNHDPTLVDAACEKFGLDVNTYDEKEPDDGT